MEVYPKLIEAIKTFSTVSSYNIIKEDLLKIVIEMFVDKSEPDILKLTAENFVIIAKSLNVEDVANVILATVIGFVINNESDESTKIESRALAAKLYGDLAMILGKDLCESYVLPQLSSLADDKNFKVRKSTVLSLVSIAELLSYSTLTNKLLPIYINLCNDNLWTIRKACVEILPIIMQIYKEKSKYSGKNEIFLNLFNDFMLDSQKFVRVSALEVFGPFISHLEKDELKANLFDFFKNSLEEYYFNIKEFGLDHQSNFYFNIKYNCAYNFPAILFCYGKQNWSQLKKIYSDLANDSDIKVKKCIISSFHEIVKLLDVDNVENDLLPIYDQFLTSFNEEIKNLSLKKLPLFMKFLNSDLRSKYRNHFQIYNLDFIINDINKIKWRNKIEIIENYENYFDVFESDLIKDKMINLVFYFCKDDVHIVRKKSSKLLSKMFINILKDRENLELVNKYLHDLATSKISKFRIQFFYVIKDLIENEFLYKEILKKILNNLVLDRICDVRICMAKVFSKILKIGRKKIYREMNSIYLNKILFKEFHVCEDLDFINNCRILSEDNKKSVRNYFENTLKLKFIPNKDIIISNENQQEIIKVTKISEFEGKFAESITLLENNKSYEGSDDIIHCINSKSKFVFEVQEILKKEN